MNDSSKLAWLHVLRRNLSNPIAKDRTYELDLMDKFLGEGDFTYAIQRPAARLKALILKARHLSRPDEGRGTEVIHDEITIAATNLRHAVQGTIFAAEKK